MKFESTKIIELGSCAFRQWKADSHCKYVHGYRLVAKFWFECTGLDEKNWVVDFGGLKELKEKLEKQFDHTLCISADDPLLEMFKTLHNHGAVDLRIMDNGVGIERTAEYCLNVANKFIQEKTIGRCWVTKVEVWEHDKNSAIAIAHKKCCEPKQIEESKSLEQILEPVQETPKANDEPKAAPLGSRVTTGFSNLFGGTSWGV
jgi:6-pyruvoyltetrahydropterin/6-carboxytetrahydropterin synthase